MGAIREGYNTDLKPVQLDFNHVAIIMHQMGFLKSNLSNKEESQLNDMYTILKASRVQTMSAENLQNVLMVIDGHRLEHIDVPNDTKNTNWAHSGVFDQETGIFYFRHGEQKIVYDHFKLLRLNRLQQRKMYPTGFAGKKAVQQHDYKPYISHNTMKLA